jgi:methylase of polypeptide subunit release factors
MFFPMGISWCLALLLCQAFDGLEMCSGTGILSRILRDGGYRVCSVDIVDWASYFEEHQPQTTGNPLDLLSPAGMALLS